jgi:hypothetical protein
MNFFFTFTHVYGCFRFVMQRNRKCNHKLSCCKQLMQLKNLAYKQLTFMQKPLYEMAIISNYLN